VEEKAREYLVARLREGSIAPPRVAVVLGSGLGDAAPGLESPVEINDSEVSNHLFRIAQHHLQVFSDNGVMLQLGRLHYYEGLDMGEVTFPVRVMASLGVEKVFMANAAGALNPVYERGYLMLLRDHINLMGVNPLHGVRDAQGNPAFLDVSTLYDTVAADALVERSRVSGWLMEEGVLVAVSGPTYETGAELRYMRLVGGDAVSMSLVPEALMARYLGMRVTAASVITNVWDMRRPKSISHPEVLQTASEAAPVLRDVIAAWLDIART